MNIIIFGGIAAIALVVLAGMFWPRPEPEAETTQETGQAQSTIMQQLATLHEAGRLTESAGGMILPGPHGPSFFFPSVKLEPQTPRVLGEAAIAAEREVSTSSSGSASSARTTNTKEVVKAPVQVSPDPVV